MKSTRNTGAAKHKWGWRRKLTSILAGIVVFSTTYALVLPAVTLDERTAADEPGIVLETDGVSGERLSALVDEPSEDADTTDATESEEDWARMFADTELTNNWADNLLAVAKTQVDYGESAEDYTEEGGVRKGYTRYGAWSGAPYGDWSAAFVAFCLHYAEIPSEAMPRETDCAKWVDALKEKELYASADEEYTPVPGDLVFFRDADDESVASVGIVYAADADADKLSVLAGDVNDRVAVTEYALSESAIAGYGKLPENPDDRQPEQPDEKIYAVSCTGLTADGAIDLEQLKPGDEAYADAVDILREQVGDLEVYDIFEIGLKSGAIESESGAVITLSNYEVIDPEHTALYHITADGQVERLAFTTGVNVVRFATTGFSPFVFAEATGDEPEEVVVSEPVEEPAEDPAKEPVEEPAEEPADNTEPANAPVRNGNGSDTSMEVDVFGVEFVSGAVENDNGDYVWTAENSYPQHRFTLSVTYSISGEFDYDVGGIQIKIPASILVDRNGTLSDTYEMSLPKKGTEGLSNENVFVYEEIEENGQKFILITNRVPVPLAQSGFIEVSYLTDKTTYDYADYDPTDSKSQDESNGNAKNGSDPFYADIHLERKNKETEEPSTYDGKTDEIPVYIDTTAEITKTVKDKPAPERQVYDGWNSSWGQAPANANDYYYIVWEVRTIIDNTTQPYYFSLKDDFTPYGEVVGYKLQGERTFTAPEADGSSHSVLCRENYTYGRYDYVLTRHPKSEFDPILDANGQYTVKNTVTATVDPKDQVDDDTIAVSSRPWTHYKPRFSPPTGHFYMYKWGLDINNRYVYDADDIRRYDMSELTGADANGNLTKDPFTIPDLPYYTYIHGYPYPWTLAQNGDSNNWEDYGKETVTFELVDNQFYLKWVGDDAYSAQLTKDDYQIDRIDLDWKMRDAEYNEQTMQFEAKPVTYTNTDKIYIYAQFDGGSDWVKIGYYDLTKAAKEALTIDAAARQYVNSDKTGYSTVVFNNSGSVCTGYRLVTSNAHYYTLLGAYPHVTLKSSQTVKQVIHDAYTKSHGADDELYGKLDGIEIALKNVAVSKAFDDKAYLGNEGETNEANRILTMVREGVDYVVGYDREGRIQKDFVAYENDTVNRRAIYTWTANACEVYVDKHQKENFVRQSSGTFYDLLPEGATYLEDSVEAYAYDGDDPRSDSLGTKLIPGTDFTVETGELNGRVLLTVHFLEGANRYTINYSSVHSWDSIMAYYRNDGKNLENEIAYRTGNDDIGHDKVTDDDHWDAFSGLIDKNDPQVILSSCEHDIGLPIAASIGLHKKVIGVSGVESYVGWAEAGKTYKYVYTFTTDNQTKATDLVLFDTLENYVTDTGAESGWHGTVVSVDLDVARKLGIDPVVYYSTQEKLAFSTEYQDLSGNYDLTNGSIWIKATGPDDPNLSQAKALAIDLRWSDAKNQTSYVLDTGKTVYIPVTMRAPNAMPPEGVNLDAYNNIYLHSTVENEMTSTKKTSNNHQDYTTITYRVVGGFDLLKVDAVTGSPIKGINFHLWNTDLGVDIWAQTNIYGGIRFQNLRPGVYALQEGASREDYVVDSTIMYIEVGRDGSIRIGEMDEEGNFTPVNDPVSFYPAISEVQTSEGVVIGFTLDNTPRVHGDLRFMKKGNVDNGQPKNLSDVEFWLHGKSDYGTNVSEYATADDGVVSFTNLDMGTYEMVETKTADGYILSHTVYTVVIDQDGNSTITYEDEAGNVQTVSQNPTTGDLEIFNEPYHSFDLLKVDAINKAALGGAEFTLTGPAPSREAVTVASDNTGKVAFTHLLPGEYILQETKAPDHHDVDPTVYKVVVATDGKVTITYNRTEDDGTVTTATLEQDQVNHWFTIADPRKLESQLTIRKIWNGGDPNNRPIPVINVSTEEPVVEGYHATIDYIYNYFYDGTTTTTSYPHSRWKTYVREASGTRLYSVTSFTRNTEAVMQKADGEKPEQVKDQHGNTWYRIDRDDNTTDCTIYYRTNGTAAEWWSDAAVIYFPEKCPYMFSNIKATKLDLSAFNTSKTENMAYMFNGASVTNVNTTGWDTSHVTEMYGMFYDCKSLTSLDVGHWDTSAVEHMAYMFHNCSALTGLTGEENWDTSSVTTMERMFQTCLALTAIDAGEWDTGNVTSMAAMFQQCQSLTTVPLSKWDTKSVNDLSGMFMFAHQDGKLSSLDMSSWDVSNVTNMGYMFHNCHKLTTVGDLRKWKTTSLKNMDYMFSSCNALTSINAIWWDTSGVTSMMGTFTGCRSIETLDLRGWDTKKVTNMFSMFNGFGKPGGNATLILGDWDLSKLTYMGAMFAYTDRLKTIYAGSKFEETLGPRYTGNLLDYTDRSPWGDSSKHNPFQNSSSIVGGKGTRYNSGHVDAEYARIDRGTSQPGYFTDLADAPAPAYTKESVASTTGTTGSLSMLSSRKLPAAALDTLLLGVASDQTAAPKNVVYDKDDEGNYTGASHYTSESVMAENNDPNAINAWIKNDDGSWTYNFEIYSGDATYYIWEDPLPGYETDSDKANPIPVTVHFNEETGKLELQSSDKRLVKVGEDADGNPIYVVQVTNTKVDDDKASLTVHKTVTGNAADYSKQFTFTVTILGEDGKPDALFDGGYGDMVFIDGVATFTLAHNQSKTAINLPVGARYTVVETDNEGYTVTYNGTATQAGGVLEQGVTAKVEVINDKTIVIPKTGDMTIEKKVVDKDNQPVNAETIDREFTFTVTLTNADGSAAAISGVYGDAIFTDGVASVSLKAGERISITGLPEGVHYKVEETASSGYELDAIQNKEGTIQTGETGVSAVVATNKKLPTGGFKVAKKVEGVYHDEIFIVHVSLAGLEPGASYAYQDGSGKETTFTALANGTAYCTLEIKDGEIYTFDKLPIGATYTVTEDASDYVASFEITNAASVGAIVAVKGDNTEVQKTISTEQETVDEGEDITVTFTNRSTDYEVRFKKVAPDGMYLIGAKLQILDKNGNVVREWTSSGNVYVTRLQEGEYTFHEAEVPKGYLRAEDVRFTVDKDGKVTIIKTDGTTETAEVVKIVSMTDQPTRVVVNKVDDQNRPLAGATLRILDKETGKTILTWVSEETPYEITGKLSPGTYILREMKAPNGYNMAEDIEFTIDETGKVLVNGTECADLTIKMVDPAAYVLPLTGGPGTRLYALCGIAMMTAAVMYGFGMRRRRERRVK